MSTLRIVFAFAVLTGVSARAAGLGDYTFVLPEGEVSKVDAFVVEDVNGLLARSVGKRLPVTTAAKAPKAKRIFVRTIPAAFDFSRLTGADAAIYVKDGDIWLFGRGANAVRYAAYDYLVVELGYRFFDVRGGVKVPDLTAYEPKDGERIVRFDFTKRGIAVPQLNGREVALFHFRTGLNSLNRSMERFFKSGDFPDGIAVDDYVRTRPDSHSLRLFFPRSRKAPRLPDWVLAATPCDYNAEHPEYFSLDKGGKRNTDHHPCLSNSDVRRILKRNYFGSLARQERPSYNILGLDDTPGRICWCEACRALEKKYGTPGGPLLDVYLEFAGEVAAKWPDQKLLLSAYRKAATQKPPVGLERLPPNIVVELAPIDDDFSKDWTHPNNAGTLADLREWCRLASEISVWYYPSIYGGGIAPPIGNIGRLATDMRLMWEAGVRTTLFEHNAGVRTMTGFAELQSYLISRLYRDTSLDWKALTREFLAFEYGPAAPRVEAYLDELETLTRAMPSTCDRFRWNAGHESCTYLTSERLAKWEASFDEMERLLADDEPRRRTLRRLRINLDYAKLVIDRDLTVAPRVREILGELCTDAFTNTERSVGRDFAKAIEQEIRIRELQYGPRAKELPAEIFGAVPKGNLKLCLPVSSAGGYADDPKAAYGIAAVLRGTQRPKAMKLPFVANIETYQPRPRYTPRIGEGVTAANIGPRGAYRFYYMGETKLTRDLHVEFGSWALRTRAISEAYEEGAFNKARIFASLRFEGPAFYPDSTGENRVFCDRVVVIRDWDGPIPLK